MPLMSCWMKTSMPRPPRLDASPRSGTKIRHPIRSSSRASAERQRQAAGTEAVREELWPDREHLGLPVLLPGGEEGRLLRFEHTADGEGWTWALEFRGRRHLR